MNYATDINVTTWGMLGMVILPLWLTGPDLFNCFATTWVISGMVILPLWLTASMLLNMWFQALGCTVSVDMWKFGKFKEFLWQF